MNKLYKKNKVDDDDKKIIPKWFYLPYCVESENFREFTNDICSRNRLHRILVTCSYCQNDIKTCKDREVRRSSCCRLIERNLKT